MKVRAIATLLAAAPLVLAGCGNDSETPKVAETVTVTAEPSPSATPVEGETSEAAEHADVAQRANGLLPDNNPLKGQIGSDDEALGQMCDDVDNRPLTAKYRTSVIDEMEDAAAEIPDAGVSRKQLAEYFDAIVEACFATGAARRYKKPVPTIDEGVWTVGVDFPAGTYRSNGDFDSCYWAISRSGSNGSDLINNDFVSGGRPTVTLSKGQDFKSQDCGRWKKVG